MWGIAQSIARSGASWQVSGCVGGLAAITVDWQDGTTSTPDSATPEANGQVSVAASHTYTSAGTYVPTVRSSDPGCTIAYPTYNHIPIVVGSTTVGYNDILDLEAVTRKLTVAPDPNPQPTPTPTPTPTPAPTPTATPTPAPQPQPQPQPAAPKISVASGTAPTSTAGAFVTLRCQGSGWCRGAVQLLSGRAVLAKGSYTLKAGTTKTLRLKLTSRGRDLVRFARHRMSASAVITPAGGRRLTKRLSLTLSRLR